MAAVTKPVPTPVAPMATPIQTSESCRSARTTLGNTEMTAPTMSARRDPKRAAKRPENIPVRKAPQLHGRIISPACEARTPRPNPVECGSWTNRVTNAKRLCIVNPTAKLTMLTLATVRVRRSRTSINGLAHPSSARTQMTKNNPVPPNSSSVRSSSQPQLVDWLTATSRHTSQAVSRTPPRMSTGARSPTRDAGMNRHATMIVGTSVINGSQNNHVTPRLVTIGPENTMPSAAPTASIADTMPIPFATRIGGNSSRRMPNANGTMAPASPWRIRAARSRPMVCATPASTVPAASTTRESIITRLRPNMSPSRPMIGVATDDDSKKPVSSHVVVVALAPRSR